MFLTIIKKAGINIRPFTKEILKELNEIFEIIVFTASHSCYANVVLDHLDPKNEFIHHRMYREHCVASKEGMYIKDLRVIKNRDLSDIIIVDNASYSFAFQRDNGIPILPYYDFKGDRELLSLVDYLKEIVNYKNIRDLNRKTFKLSIFEKYDDVNAVVENEFKEFLMP
jgi:CTD small phosphatase-like protein 2